MLLPKFKDKPEIYYYSKDFDYYLIDGRGFYYLLKLFGRKPRTHISIPDFAEFLIDFSNKQNLNVFLLGATPEINSLAQKNIKQKYPNIHSIDGLHGYFNEDEESEIVEKINEKSPDILLVGISSPKKEKFVHFNRNNIKAKIILLCGGVIDVFAGKTKREPKILKYLGLAWFYRFLQEPKRLFNTMILGFFKVIFLLIPAIIFNKLFNNKEFSIPQFFGIKTRK